MRAGGPFRFTTAFRNSVGTEVAGTWFDEEVAAWKLSTVPLRTFPTEPEAIAFYRSFCDLETGIQNHAFRANHALIRSLEREIERGAALKERGAALLSELKQALGNQRDSARNLKHTVARSNHAN